MVFNKVFFHVCIAGDWFAVYQEMMELLISSGLIYECELNICVSGDFEQFWSLNTYSQTTIKIYRNGNDISTFEFPTLKNLYDEAITETDETYYLYIHTKGVTRSENSVIGWRKYMTYFNIDKWREAVELLKDHSAVGVDYQEGNPHYLVKNVGWFAGNFWWTKSSHIKKLIDPITCNNRLLAEFWLGSVDKEKFNSMWQSNNNHYQNFYPESVYKKL